MSSVWGVMTRQLQCLLLRILLSIVIAYPVAGVVYAPISLIMGAIKDSSFITHNPGGFILILVIGSLWYGLCTPMFLGFPITDEAGAKGGPIL